MADPPYSGPPAYRGGHPSWSFPPVVWQEELPPAAPRRSDPSGALRAAGALAAVAALVGLVAAGAETWRFALMLQGRTQVLAGSTVLSSDVLVAAAGSLSVAAVVAAMVVGVVALTRTHPVAALRLGRAPSRSTGAVLARLLVPGWNLYGAGQVVTEIDRMLSTRAARVDRLGPVDGTASAGRPVRASRLTVAWWASWLVSAGLMLATLARGLGGSLQAIADTVELHIAVDLAAAVCAGLGAAMLFRFAGLLRRRAAIPAGWVVQEPAATRG